MDKIISQTLEVESVYEPVQKFEEVIHFEVWDTDINVKMTGLTPIGYDDEIGLWEDQEHRRR